MNLRILAAVLVVGWICGCAWTPSRDNPVDPASPYYEKPPQRNRAPVIDTVFVVTECRASELNPFCIFDVVAEITDADRNLNYNSVLVTILMDTASTMTLGLMVYYPERDQFILTRSQNDFPNENLDQLVGRPVRVSISDDSGSVATRSVSFPQPVRDPAPLITFPHGQPVVPDEIHSDTVRLSWDYWTGPDREHSLFSTAVFFKNIYMVWDTSGLLPTDTFTVVTDTLEPSTFDQSIFYTWYLTVTDSRGNRLTSQPGYFYYFPPTEPPAMLRPEHSELE